MSKTIGQPIGQGVAIHNTWKTWRNCGRITKSWKAQIKPTGLITQKGGAGWQVL